MKKATRWDEQRWPYDLQAEACKMPWYAGRFSSQQPGSIIVEAGFGVKPAEKN